MHFEFNPPPKKNTLRALWLTRLYLVDRSGDESEDTNENMDEDPVVTPKDIGMNDMWDFAF